MDRLLKVNELVVDDMSLTEVGGCGGRHAHLTLLQVLELVKGEEGTEVRSSELSASPLTASFRCPLRSLRRLSGEAAWRRRFASRLTLLRSDMLDVSGSHCTPDEIADTNKQSPFVTPHRDVDENLHLDALTGKSCKKLSLARFFIFIPKEKHFGTKYLLQSPGIVLSATDFSYPHKPSSRCSLLLLLPSPSTMQATRFKRWLAPHCFSSRTVLSDRLHSFVCSRSVRSRS